ncbi:MAG: cellulose biosynthesis cyclic di-GMP-binding regulatory protein BcsB [Candidatus Competibacter denitrificans]
MNLRTWLTGLTRKWLMQWLLPLLLLLPGVAGAATLERALSHFMAGQQGPLWLRGANAQSDISVPLPARWRSRDLKLNLVYRNSVNLLRDHSQLRVELNGLVIAQFPLDPNRPEGRATIRLPTELLQAGYNQLRFAAAQHTLVGQCEDPAAPELWTQIDAQQSILQLDYERLPVAAHLSQINQIFDRHHWDQARVQIPMIQPKPDDNQLRWGALVAQAAALHLEYVPLQVNFGPALRAKAEPNLKGQFPQLDPGALGDTDLVLIGVREQLAPFLGPEWAKKVEDGYLAIFPRDDDPTLALLVISGRNEAEVSRAATLLGLLDIAFPDSRETLITALNVPLLPPNSGPRYLPTATGVRFEQLGVPTTTLGSPLQPASLFASTGSASGDGRAARQVLSVEFWAASSGLYAGGTPKGTLSLHFSYGAGLRRDSVLNILLNGKLVKGIALDNFQGGDFNGYKVEFPLNLVQAGRNKIELVPIMVPSVTDYCDLRQGENLLLTLYDDSSLQLPSASPLAQLPDLRLLTQAGFPFLHDPQGKDLAVRVMGTAPESIAAAWTLLARLAQITALPLHQAQIGFDPDVKDRETIIVGPLDSLEPAQIRALPISFGDASSQVHYPMPATVGASAMSGGWLEQRLAEIEHWFNPQPGGALEIRTAQAELRGKPLDRYAALTAFQSPTQAGRSVLLLTAREPALLQERAWQLAQPGYWYNLRGAVALWSDRPDSLRWQDAESHYMVGEGAAGTRLSHYFSYYPWALLIITFLLLLGLALFLLALLRRFKRRQHPEIDHAG